MVSDTCQDGLSLGIFCCLLGGRGPGLRRGFGDRMVQRYRMPWRCGDVMCLDLYRISPGYLNGMKSIEENDPAPYVLESSSIVINLKTGTLWHDLDSSLMGRGIKLFFIYIFTLLFRDSPAPRLSFPPSSSFPPPSSPASPSPDPPSSNYARRYRTGSGPRSS